MTEYGRIVSAKLEVEGSELAAAYDPLDDELTLRLEDALGFPEPTRGQTVQVRLISEDGLTTEIGTIKVPGNDDEDTVDEETGVIKLAVGLTNSFDVGTRVEVHQETQRLIAHVRLNDAEEEEELIDAVVDTALLEKIQESTDLDTAVELEYDGETYYVTNIQGEEPTMEIRAGTFTGGTFRTIPAGPLGFWIRISNDTPQLIEFLDDNDVKRAQIEAGPGTLNLERDDGVVQIRSISVGVEPPPLDLQMRTTDPPAPPAGVLRLYAFDFGDAGRLRVRSPDGSIRNLDWTTV